MISRRLFTLGLIYCGVTGLLASRFYYLQILRNKKYETLSDSNRIKVLFIEPIRGKILDVQGRLLSTNNEFYNIDCDPEHVLNINSLITALSQAIRLDTKTEENIRKKFLLGKSFTIKSDASWKVIAAMEFNKTQLDGVYISKHYQRFYPYRESCSHLIGYLSSANGYRYPMNYYTGKAGLELTYEEELQGKPGMLQREVNSRGIIVRALSSTPSVNGKDMKTSINADVQQHVYNAFKGKIGAAVLMDTRNGNLLTLCSSPGYDNNKFVDILSNEEWENIKQDPRKVMLNRALSLQIPPGSIFKIVTALAALESKIIGPNTLFECKGHMIAGKRKFNCWKSQGHGEINLVDAISQSCNTFFYQIGMKIPIDVLIETASALGLGKSFNVRLPEELPGMMPYKKWRQAHLKHQWFIGDNLNAVIGHGYILSTPLQLAVLTSRVASGRMIIPTLKHNPFKIFPTLGFSEENLELVRKGMAKTINSKSGTAHYIYDKAKFKDLAGKTGTAQVVSKQNRNHSYPDHHALFVGYTPVNNPKYALSVVVEHGGAGKNAAVIAKEIFEYLKPML